MVTLRLPPADYRALSSFAMFTGASMNDVLVRALRAFLTDPAVQVEIKKSSEAFLAEFRRAIADVPSDR